MTGAVPNPTAGLAGIASREADRLRKEQLARLARRTPADQPTRESDEVSLSTVEAVTPPDAAERIDDAVSEAGREDHDEHAGVYEADQHRPGIDLSA